MKVTACRATPYVATIDHRHVGPLGSGETVVTDVRTTSAARRKSDDSNGHVHVRQEEEDARGTCSARGRFAGWRRRRRGQPVLE